MCALDIFSLIGTLMVCIRYVISCHLFTCYCLSPGILGLAYVGDPSIIMQLKRLCMKCLNLAYILIIIQVGQELGASARKEQTLLLDSESKSTIQCTHNSHPTAIPLL